MNYQTVVSANIPPEHLRYVLILLNITRAPGYLNIALDDEECVCSGMCLVFAFWKTSKTDKTRGWGGAGYIYYILHEGFIIYPKDLSCTFSTYVRRAVKAP